MLQVVSINSKDIIATSTMSVQGNYGDGVTIAAPDRFNDYDAGY